MQNPSSLVHKPNVLDAMARLRTFYERRAMDRILAVFSLPSPTVAEFRRTHTEGPCDYPDPAGRVRFWDRFLAERVALEDDSVPSAYLSEFDQGLYGGVLGGDVRFNCSPDTGWISSMVYPLMKEWSELGQLRMDQAHPWFERYEKQLRVFREGARGRFGIGHFILINGLNFLFELVGATATYLALIDRPDDVRRALALGFDVNLEIQKRFFSAIPMMEGGTCGFLVQWVPGRIVAESVDPFHMTSVETFEQWGREASERFLGTFDGGVTHIHGNGRHLIEAVSSIRGLKAIILGDDKGYPPAIEVLGDVRRRAGDMPLTAGVPFEAFKRRLDRHELPGGVIYQVSGAPDADQANACMERVRAYRT